MTTIVFIAPDQRRTEIDGADGLSVMECARRANVAGIIAECGGACSCATCHVYVAPERDMLEFADGVQDNSRLSCQIKLTPALAGLTLRLPDSQG